MRDDGALRWWLVGTLVIAFAIIAYHRVRAHRSVDRFDRRQEGWFILMTLRPVAFVFLISLVLYLLNPPRIAWAAVPLPLWVRWSGIAMIGATSALLLWTLHSLGGNLTDTVATRTVHTLVVNGPYRWVRHPFYDAVALLLSGVSLVSANWFMLATGAAVFTLLAVRARTEERMLVARFGDDYRRYMTRTNRFLPRVRTD
jgi:protein-S-isoprenylcysteine O-methyltransferase Ste14